MRGRGKVHKRRKRKQTKTLKDFFPVEPGVQNHHEECCDEVKCTGANAADEQTSSVVNSPRSVSKTERRREIRALLSTTLKDFYPVRRSSRKTENELKQAQFQEIENALLSGEEKGLEVCHIDGKGRGVIAARSFRRGDFVVEYRGDLIDHTEAKRREKTYEQDTNVGCYMYYFNHKNQTYCVDATAETCYLGRLVNHSAKEPNCVTRIVEVKGQPRLILVASRNIEIGEELLYDYGDRNRESIQANPWLLNS